MGPVIHKRGPWTVPVICRRPLLGEDKCVSGEIGAAAAGVQIKFAAGGSSWIPATGVFGAMSGAKMPKCSKRVQRLLRSSAGNK